MKALLVHNLYQQPGGEDVVAEQEAALLRQAGHEVIEYSRSNHEIDTLGLWGKLTLPQRVVWADDAVRDIKALVRQEKPDIAHFHNTFLMISPGAYYACQAMGVPVVQTLHNYRLLCPRADFFRKRYVCEDCLGKMLPWPGIIHGCYHKSRVQTAAVASMVAIHRRLKTWHEQVDSYIALTEFARQKFIQGGLPTEKITVKPNFVHPDPGVRDGEGDYVIFVGRFSPEKKLSTLLQAWKGLEGISLKLVGGGPEEDQVRWLMWKFRLNNIELLGWRSHQETFAAVKKAYVLVFTSEWYETFGLALIEAFACGVPVIASRLGAMTEIVEEGHTGLLFTPGDPEDLALKVRWATAHPEALARMGKNARQVYEEKYTPEKNYQMLLEVYDRVVGTARLKQRLAGKPDKSSSVGF